MRPLFSTKGALFAGDEQKASKQKTKEKQREKLREKKAGNEIKQNDIVKSRGDKKKCEKPTRSCSHSDDLSRSQETKNRRTTREREREKKSNVFFPLSVLWLVVFWLLFLFF